MTKDLDNLVKEFANGSDTFKRRTLSFGISHKRNDDRYRIIK